ncbi:MULTISPECIES: APC family permease [Microbispora]|uniref:Transporter n=1 Tax=Microbispora siamensis TaxID=564413 RepID=A0ABQ4GV69_9ACTN|nr:MULTISPECIES: APC family permease [Microbispora]OPG03628.1 Putrescine importer PuuP [Microbispora sp. GKU 823]GIH65336.1 transporter [Microbispora siamensis]
MTEPAGLKRVLGVPGLTLFGLTYLAPVAVFTTYGAVTQVTEGHLPAAYVVALVVMLFTAFSYGRMARAYPTAGSAYTYTQQTFGGHIGFMTGWTLMLDYLFLPMINFLLIGIYLNSQFPEVPQWIFTLAALLLVLVLNVVGITVMNRVNVLVVGLSVVLIVVFAALSLKHLAGHPAPSPFAPFTPGSGVFAGAAILALSFLGFDAVSTLSEEAREPRRAIPRAIVLTTLIGGLLFILVAWMGSLVHPGYDDFANADTAGVDIMSALGGAAFETIFVGIYVVGAFGSAMTTQASVSRILYSMGRDGVLPRAAFARLHPRFRTPIVATAVVSAVSLVALFISLDNAVVMVNFGALIAFSMVNLTVVKHYVLDEGRRSAADLVRYGLVPLVGFALTIWLWTSLSGVTFTVGLIWMAVGFVYLLALTRMFTRRPPVMSFSDAEPTLAA